MGRSSAIYAMTIRPAAAEVFKRLPNLLPQLQTTVANLLREDTPSANLDLVRCRFELPNRCLNTLQYLSNRMLEDQPI